jgi:pimeloyl-ACP methyl ester carboxylesterase
MPEDASPETRDTVVTAVDRFLGAHDSTPGRTDVDPLRLANLASPRFLIVHGDADRQVGIRQARWLHDGLTTARVRSEMVVIRGAGHIDPAFSSEAEVDRVREFLRDAWC